MTHGEALQITAIWATLARLSFDLRTKRSNPGMLWSSNVAMGKFHCHVWLPKGHPSMIYTTLMPRNICNMEIWMWHLSHFWILNQHEPTISIACVFRLFYITYVQNVVTLYYQATSPLEISYPEADAEAPQDPLVPMTVLVTFPRYKDHKDHYSCGCWSCLNFIGYICNLVKYVWWVLQWEQKMFYNCTGTPFYNLYVQPVLRADHSRQTYLRLWYF
jgi:hypothetical protein